MSVKDFGEFPESASAIYATKNIKKDGDDDEVWKFAKVKQVWLLKNMYNLEKVPSKSFKDLLLYIETVKGDGKKRVR